MLVGVRLGQRWELGWLGRHTFTFSFSYEELVDEACRFIDNDHFDSFVIRVFVTLEAACRISPCFIQDFP